MVNSSLIVKFLYVLICASLIYLAFHGIFIRKYDAISNLQAAYATIIVALGLLPAVITFLSKREGGLIPLMPLHGLFYALTFGLPVFFIDEQSIQPLPEFGERIGWIENGEDKLSKVLIITIFGQIFLYFGYYIFPRFFGGLKPIKARDIPLGRQIKFAWLLFLCYVLFNIFPKLRTVPSIEQLMTPLCYMSIGILTLLALNRKLTYLHSMFLILAAVFVGSNLLLSGSLAPIVLFLVFLGIIYWNKKRTIPWVFIVVCILITVILNPVKSKFRIHTWYAQDRSETYYDKAILLGRVVKEHYADTSVLEKITSDKGIVHRLAHISTFAYVAAVTPDSIPYWSGDTYYTLWTSFIPRIFWPGKPQSTIGQDFGHRYGLIQTYDMGTSMNLPWIIELYANFGLWGILTGMFFIGVFFHFLLQKLKVSVEHPIEHVLAVTITFSLFYAESNFALMVGGILPIFIVFMVLVRLITLQSSKK
jgi:hypothetical protein